jgi:hypothetical protein
MWEPRRLTILWHSTACYRNSFHTRNVLGTWWNARYVKRGSRPRSRRSIAYDAAADETALFGDRCSGWRDVAYLAGAETRCRLSRWLDTPRKQYSQQFWGTAMLKRQFKSLKCALVTLWSTVVCIHTTCFIIKQLCILPTGYLWALFRS